MRSRRTTVLIAVLLLLLVGGTGWLATSLVERAEDGSSGGAATAMAPDANRDTLDDATAEISRRKRLPDREPATPSAARDDRADDVQIKPEMAHIDSGLLASARGVAERAIEEIRDDIHRATMNVIWSPESALPPPDGAEIVVLRGYLDQTLFRVVWSDGVATGTWLDPSRALREDAASSGGRRFTVDAGRFVIAWTAARLVLGARAERKTPLPDGGRRGGRFSTGSHAPYLVAFLRESADTRLHAFEQRGAHYDGEDVRSWDQIRDRAIHALLSDVVDRDRRTPAPLDVWLPFFHTTLSELGREGDIERGSPDRHLLEVVLRTLGDTGDARTLELLDALAQRISTPELPRAHLRVQLRVRWDGAEAEAAIVPVHRSERRDSELVGWIRARYRIVDPDGYREMLLRHLLDGDLDTKLVKETQDELVAHCPEALRGAMVALLPHQDARVRVEAALTLVGLDDLDASVAEQATEVLRAAAADPDIRRPYWERTGDWPRSLAIRHLASRGEWGPDELRRRILVRGEDGALIELIETLLADAGRPLTHVEARDAYRGVLDRRQDAGMLIAIRRLIELDDRPSFERMRTLLDELAISPADEEVDLVGYSHRRFTVRELRERL